MKRKNRKKQKRKKIEKKQKKQNKKSEILTPTAPLSTHAHSITLTNSQTNVIDE